MLLEICYLEIDTPYIAVYFFQDVKQLISNIQNLLGSYEIDNWNHLDFIWGVDAAKIVYDKIIKIMKEHP